jgi:hypothetical protein
VPPADPAIRRVAVHTGHTIPDRPPIRLHIGEEVQVALADDHESGWLWCRAGNGAEGWVPARTVNPVS